MRISKNENNLDMIDILTIFSVFLQLKGVEADANTTSNDDLMRELQRVDNEYLRKIIAQNEEILQLLKK